MAATKLNINISAVSVCGTAVTKVTAASIIQGSQFIKHSADADKFKTTAVNVMNEPKINITTNDVGLAESLKGLTGSTTVTANDAKLASSGAITWTYANSYVEDVNINNSHMTWSSATVSIDGTSVDGTTNPLTSARS